MLDYRLAGAFTISRGNLLISIVWIKKPGRIRSWLGAKPAEDCAEYVGSGTVWRRLPSYHGVTNPEKILVLSRIWADTVWGPLPK